MKRRVVITGLGIVSPVGNDVQTAWDNIVQGRSGIGRVTRFDASVLNSQIAGEVKGFEVTDYMGAKEAKQMDSFIHYGVAAGIQAWRDSG
ncbi:MAG: beta-ketoacyl synthase N-terminal-like domain-containing protein, partial [Castellaniella sp.]